MNRSAVFVAVLLSLAAAGRAGTSGPPPSAEALELWKDPVFQKQFIGSYAFAPDLEPKVTPEERDQLQKILPLMATDLAAAARQLEKLVRPDASAVYDFTLANIYFQQEQNERAAECYRAAIRKFPAFRRAHKNLGLICVRANLHDEAIQSFTRVLELGGGDAVTYGLLGHSYAAREDYVSAESAYRSAVLLQPASLDWKLGLARCLLKQQKYGEAATLFGELCRAHPDRTDLWLLQANAWIGQKEPLKAAQNFELLARMDKATVDSLHTLGDIYVNEGMFELAASAYQRALALDPTQPVSRPLRSAEILASRGAYPEARSLLSAVRTRYTDQLDEAARKKILKLEARIAVSEGGGADAVKVLEEIVALDPLDGEALLLLGQHHAAAGDSHKAMFYYERAASLDAFEADAKVRLAQLLVSQAKLQEAVPLLRRAHELKPRESVARYLEQVERIAKARR